MVVREDDKHMLIAIILALLLVGGSVLYFGSNQQKQNTTEIQYLSIAPATASYDPAPPIKYNSQLDVYLDSLDNTQVPTWESPRPIQPFYFGVIKTVVDLVYSPGNNITRERVILVNQK